VITEGENICTKIAIGKRYSAEIIVQMEHFSTQYALLASTANPPVLLDDPEESR
jgi:hypothetical protein